LPTLCIGKDALAHPLALGALTAQDASKVVDVCLDLGKDIWVIRDHSLLQVFFFTFISVGHAARERHSSRSCPARAHHFFHNSLLITTFFFFHAIHAIPTIFMISIVSISSIAIPTNPANLYFSLPVVILRNILRNTCMFVFHRDQ